MTTTIELSPATANESSYGIRYVSAPYSLEGARVRNPGHPHTVRVWANKPNDNPEARVGYPDSSEFSLRGEGRYVGPDGHGTDDAFTITLDAGAVIIDGNPHPRAGTLTLGDTVELTLDGAPFGKFIITRRPLADPVLVVAS
jgi:hypothetical protein